MPRFIKHLTVWFVFLAGLASVLRSEVPDGTEVVFVDHEAMAAAFKVGQRLVTNKNYNVSASRRDKVGTAEIHEKVTDIFYFVSGTATFVTGGDLVESRQTGPGEWRGSSSKGGTSRAVSPGDVIVVPKGTTHWFSAVNGEIKYYIVKVIE
jgi:mannose-6-phosphate isomerase-like protein (cupin superfamily)